MVHREGATPRERRHEANLERILDAAMEMVASGGFDALSMARLAQAADYTPGALYRYFGSKDALLATLVERILAEVRASLDGAAAKLAADTSQLARVFALVSGYRAFARRRPHRFGLLAMSMASPRVLLDAPKDAEPVVRSILAALEPLADALRAAAADDELAQGDVAERTLCLFATVQGLLQLHKQARYAPGVLDIDRLVLRGTEALLLGWGARPRAVERAAEIAATIGGSAGEEGGAS